MDWAPAKAAEAMHSPAGSGTKFDATSSYAQDFDAKEMPSGRQGYTPDKHSSKPLSSGKFEGTKCLVPSRRSEISIADT